MDSPGGTAARQQRSDSTGSASSSGTERRKSVGLFSSLEQQMRSNNPDQVARRNSMHDHKPAPGMFGRWWNGYVHGTSQK